MRAPAVAAGLLFCVTIAVGATQVQGQASAAPAFEVASVKHSNPDPANPLSSLPMILPAGAGLVSQLGFNIPNKACS